MVTTEPRPARRVLRYVGRTFLTLAGVVVALFTYFVCQGMFSGYPQYGTNILSYIGLSLVSATGGLAWIIDHRRIRNDDD